MRGHGMNKLIVEIDKVQDIYSGLGQFCINLGQELIKLQPKDFELDFALSEKTPKPFIDFGNYHLVKKIRRYWSGKENNQLIWHSTHQDSSYLPQKGSKLVLTIHDLNFLEKYSSQLRQKWRLNLIQKKIDRASALTTISKYTANQIHQHLNTRGLPLHVIYNGCVLPPKAATTPMQPVQGNFLFNIGVIQPRKNLEVLIPMMKLLPDFKLVITGSAQPKYLAFLKAKVNELGLHTRIIFTGPVSDSEKYWYYQQCCGFVFPSRSEGFGLPIVEAMHAGKPVFLSTHTCLPEIGGQLANYWPSFEPDQMKSVLELGLNNHTPELSAALQARAQLFSWQKSAEQYWQVYKSIL